MDELDRVLGGGFVAGEVVLIGGDPGVGKSTLLLQVLARISAAHKAVYVSGEESAEQVALRARRLALDSGKLELLAEIQLERILATLEKRSRKSPSSTRSRPSTRSSSPPLPARSRRCASAWRT